MSPEDTPLIREETHICPVHLDFQIALLMNMLTCPQTRCHIPWHAVQLH